MAHVIPLFRELHWLPVCFWAKFKVLGITLMPFMAWIQLSEELSHSSGIGPPHPCWQRGYTTDPVSQGISADGVQEKSLFCHGSCPLEHHISDVRSAPTLLTFRKGLKLAWLCRLAWDPSMPFLKVAVGLGKTTPLPVYFVFFSSLSFNSIYYCYFFV